MGRPLKEIDWEQFEKLCMMHCTKEEIASWFNCSIETIENKAKLQYGETFSALYKEFKCHGKISLRRHMWQSAEKGNTGMMVWLSKQHLDMKDKIEHDVETSILLEKINKIKNLPREELIRLVKLEEEPNSNNIETESDSDEGTDRSQEV